MEKQKRIQLLFFSCCLLLSLLCIPGCADELSPAPARKLLPCQAKTSTLPSTDLPPPVLVPGSIPASFSLTPNGEANYVLPLTLVPGRAGLEPKLSIAYNSASDHSVLGSGFSLAGLSSITRCPQSLAHDSDLRDLRFDGEDPLCLDGLRLIPVKENPGLIEYRTFPDRNTKILGHFLQDASFKNPNNALYFEAFEASGLITEYGRGDKARPMAKGNIPRVFLANKSYDRRGNSIYFDYCFSEADGYTAEYAIHQIRYTGFEGEPALQANRSVRFVYGEQNPSEARIHYARGMAFQQSLRLDEIQMIGPGDNLVRRYAFSYTQSPTTGRSLLQQIQECGADGACKVPTRFFYSNPPTGFERIITPIPAPTSRRASPMLADMDGDGLDDLLIPDTNPAQSTPSQPITEWKIAKNQGPKASPPFFSGLQIAFSQDWPLFAEPTQPADSALIQPELGTALDYNQDGRADLWLHDVYGAQNHEFLLLSQPDQSLKPHDSGLERPFPLGNSPPPPRMTSPGASIHLADLNGDGAADRIQCVDHGDTPGLSAWRFNLWKPGIGFDPNAKTIEVLTGFPCAIEVYTSDLNADGKVDLMLPSMSSIDGVPSMLGSTYSALSLRSDGSFEVIDTKLKLLAAAGRLLLADINGDRLPDAVMSGFSDHRLRNFLNTGLGFEQTPRDSLPWDGIGEQDAFFHLATPLDANGDGLHDLLMPLQSTLPIPEWKILRSKGKSFEPIDLQIPFEPWIGDTITPADPRGPRIGDLNGDGAPDVLLLLAGKFNLFKNLAADADLLVGVSDGSNDRNPDEAGFVPNLEISYGHLSEGEIYKAHSNPANDCAYPLHCAVGSKRVVSGYAHNDGSGAQRTFRVEYRDGRYHKLGFGFLGFERRLIHDLDTGSLSVEQFENTKSFQLGDREIFPYAGLLSRRWQAIPALATESDPNKLRLVLLDISPQVLPSNDNQSYVLSYAQRRERVAELSYLPGQSLEELLGQADKTGSFVRDTTLVFSDLDAFGNAQSIDAKTTGADLSLHIEREFEHDSDRWLIGRLKQQKECSTAAKSTQCRTLKHIFNAFGELESEEKDSDPPDARTYVLTRYERDAFGNIQAIISEDGHQDRREYRIEFDAEGVFPLREINALGHITTLEYDPRFGRVTQEIDPNQLVTKRNFDSLGRLKSEEHPDGTHTEIARSRIQSEGMYRTLQRRFTPGGQDQSTEFDSLGRPIRLLWHGADTEDDPGTPPRLMQVMAYDRLSGQIQKRSLTAHENTPEAQLEWDEFEYDALGRQIQHITPWKAINQTIYKGLSTESIDALNYKTITEHDALGRPLKSTDALAGVTSYAYGPFGALHSVQDPGGAIYKTHRDAFGRPYQVEDPDRGLLILEHNGYGELLASTDALGRIATFTYDALGRRISRTDSEGAKTSITAWIFDMAEHGIGRLYQMKSPDAEKTFEYDALGRLKSTSLLVQGESEALSSSLGYDVYGRIESIRYPSPQGAEPFVVSHKYNAYGYLLAVSDKVNGDLYWRLSSVDVAGRIRKEIFGNGIETERSYDNEKDRLKNLFSHSGPSLIQSLAFEYDAKLNLEMRKDALQPQHTTERFRYDALSRLTCAYFSLQTNDNAPCAQSYAYLPNGNLNDASDIGIYSYNNPAHPHAHTQAGAESYGYDAVGNQISRPGGVTLKYTPFDLPQSISAGPNSATFGYDGDQRRIRKTTPLEETLYLGDLYERVTEMGSAKTEHRYYVHSPERTIAVVSRSESGSGIQYIHADHLGSTHLLTGEFGQVLERRSHDAYGKRRNEIWGQAPPPSFAKSVSKDFTGHEADFELGLVNMKGRIYDPQVGRFLTADPWVVGAWDGQAWNGYSYVLNNPLTFVDPSGFVPEPPPILPLFEAHWTSGDGTLNVMMFYPPREGMQPIYGEDVGASEPALDVSTLGNTPEVVAPDYASVPMIPVGLPGGPGAPVNLPGGPGAGPLNAPGPFKPGAFGPGTFIEPSAPGANVPARAPGLPTGPAKAPGVGMGNVLGGAAFILSMGLSFAGDAPELGFDEEGIPLNKNGMRYPRVIDPRTGKVIPFPEGELRIVPLNQRTERDPNGKEKFVREWHQHGYPRMPGNWDGSRIHLHHIKPLARGGTNDFWNLVPLSPEEHQQFTDYWRDY